MGSRRGLSETRAPETRTSAQTSTFGSGLMTVYPPAHVQQTSFTIRGPWELRSNLRREHRLSKTRNKGSLMFMHNVLVGSRSGFRVPGVSCLRRSSHFPPSPASDGLLLSSEISDSAFHCLPKTVPLLLRMLAGAETDYRSHGAGVACETGRNKAARPARTWSNRPRGHARSERRALADRRVRISSDLSRSFCSPTGVQNGLSVRAAPGDSVAHHQLGRATE